MSAATITVPRRFNGPPSSGNGGFSAGALAEEVAPADAVVTVRLRRPPPLDVALEVGPPDDDGWRAALQPDGEVVMTARVDPDVALRAVPGVPLATARDAESAYAGLRSHPFPTCVVCGTERPDGLGVHPGRVGDADGAVRVAGTWVPEESGTSWVWAALDCIGAWAGDLEERMMVLGTMTARVDAAPEPGAEHVVVGADRGTEGRRTRSAATLYAPDGRVIATAEHTWIAVDPRAFS